MTSMSAPELGPWEPLSLDSAVATFDGAPVRWWISGGHALELHLQRSWRTHDDIDVGVLRSELTAVFADLQDWDLHVASSGTLAPWRGEPLDLDRHQNNVWARRSASDPWAMDVTIGEGNAEEWIYRRDASVRVGWDRAVLRSASGVPYLAPELQLLYKSTGPRPKDDLDASVVVPTLSPHQLAFLATSLAPDHPWRRLLG